MTETPIAEHMKAAPDKHQHVLGIHQKYIKANISKPISRIPNYMGNEWQNNHLENFMGPCDDKPISIFSRWFYTFSVARSGGKNG